MRKALVESDKLEAIVTFVGGVFYSTGVSACALILNNNKVPDHKNKICLVDASKIYTPQRAQKIMSETDIETVYNLYSNYQDVIEKCKVVTLDEIAQKDYSLAVNNYIKQPKEKPIDPVAVKQEFLQAVDAVKKAENKLKELLVAGGYVHESN